MEAYSDDSGIPERRIHKFDREDHNLLGALQLASKALEIWFELIAVALVYLVTMLLAGKKEGLPIGYLTRPNEFADIPGLLDTLLWTTLPKKHHRQAFSGRARLRIWAFILMTLALCVLCNLMGPATAVLVIPSLQWIDTPKVGNTTFAGLNTADPPSTTGFAYSDTFEYTCDEADFNAWNYSCAAHDWAEKLDSWTTQWVAAASEGSFSTIAQEYDLTFTMNQTSANPQGEYVDFLYWVPNRQLVKSFSDDRTVIAGISEGLNATGICNADSICLSDDEFDTYRPYNKSLQMQLQRNGPIVGTYPNFWTDNTGSLSWTTTIDENRRLQCFARYSYGYYGSNSFSDGGNSYTKCIQDGSGWGGNTQYANFTIDGAYDLDTNTIGPGITFEIFSSDRVAFLANGTLPTGMSEKCLFGGSDYTWENFTLPTYVNGSVPKDTTCDWNALFNAPAPATNASEYVTTLRMTMSDGNKTAVLAVDYIAYSAFMRYSLDPSQLTNPLMLVQTQSTPANGTAQPLHPAWTLAAWSVDNGGSLPANRSTTIMLLRVMQDLLDGSLYDDDTMPTTEDTNYEYGAVTYLPILQTLSMIEYETTNTTIVGKITKAMTDGRRQQPVLYRNANMYVWAYGMSSRTAYLGVLVALLGSLVVLTQFFMGLVYRRRYRSPTQLLVAALEHAPKGEFDGREHDEEEMARVRFHVRDAAHTAGKFSFYSPHLS